jgi:hypothetical protein
VSAMKRRPVACALTVRPSSSVRKAVPDPYPAAAAGARG